MSQGIFKATEKLEDMIEAITPKTDSHHGFIALGTGNGRTQPLDQRPNSTRYFEINTLNFASDDGEAGLSGRKRTSMELRVRYDIPQDLGFLKRLINEDASKLIDTLNFCFFLSHVFTDIFYKSGNSTREFIYIII